MNKLVRVPYTCHPLLSLKFPKSLQLPAHINYNINIIKIKLVIKLESNNVIKILIRVVN